MELRAAMSVELAGQAMCIKDRTIRTNYATGYAVRIYTCVLVKLLSHQHRLKIQVLRKLYEIFSGVWHDLGYTWDDCMEWMVTRHIPAMQIIHVEVNLKQCNLCSILSIVSIQTSHALNAIRRYVIGLTDFLADWELQKKRQVCI